MTDVIQGYDKNQKMNLGVSQTNAGLSPRNAAGVCDGLPTYFPSACSGQARLSMTYTQHLFEPLIR